jgi:hypothetical protein
MERVVDRAVVVRYVLGYLQMLNVLKKAYVRMGRLRSDPPLGPLALVLSVHRLHALLDNSGRNS